MTRRVLRCYVRTPYRNETLPKIMRRHGNRHAVKSSRLLRPRCVRIQLGTRFMRPGGTKSGTIAHCVLRIRAQGVAGIRSRDACLKTFDRGAFSEKSHDDFNGGKVIFACAAHPFDIIDE